MLRVCLVLTWFFALGAPPASAQEQPSKVVSVAQPSLRFERVVEGLPQTNVRAISQDKRGFMWFGTQDGAARFDGVQFVAYRPKENDPTSLSHKLVHAMTVDAKGDLWIGTESGLDRYDAETDHFKRYLFDANNAKGVAAAAVSALHADRQGRLWIAYAEGGLDQYDPATDSFRHEKAPEFSTPITAISSDDKELWLATDGDGVLRWTPGTAEVATFRHTPDDPSTLGDDAVSAIMVDRSGVVWAGTKNGLCKIDPGGKVTCYLPREDDPNSLSHAEVSVLLEDRGGHLWVGTYRGFNLFDPKTGRFVQYHTDEQDQHSISYEHQTSIYQDRGGVIWVGTFGGGASKFDEMQLGFAYFRTGNTAAVSFFQDQDRTLWVGSYQRGLFKFERERGRVTRYARLTDASGATLDLESTWISAIHRDKQGTLWLATQTLGLVGMDTQRETFVRMAPQAADADAQTPALWAISEDASGALWLAGSNSEGAGGLIRFEPRSRTFSMSCCAEDDPAKPSIALYTVRPDVSNPNVLWLGGADSLGRFDTTTNKTTNWFNDENNPRSIPEGGVLSTYQEPSGILWLGTASGLARFDPGTGTADRMGAESGVPSNEIYGVLPDDAGRLWLSTNNHGLLVFDTKARKVVLSFRPEDGLQDNEFAQGGSMRGRDGELFFGGPKGFNAFFPDRIATDKYAPPVALTSFKLFNRELALGQPVWTVDEISLGYRDSVFALEFAALSFASPQRTRYAYRMSGVHDWIESTRPFVNYTNLDHGTYEFELKAMNRHGVWSEKPLKVNIVIARPPWLTWWAFALYGLAFVALALLVWRYLRRRVRLLRQENRLKSVERDLELISAVQTGFLPQNNHVVSRRFELFGFYRPADVCSGDWWWYEETAPGHHAFLVGDVTGHGAGPAMVTAAAATAFRVQTGTSMEQRLHSLNREVLTVGGDKYLMTLSGLELDDSTGEITFYAAGGLPAIKLGENQSSRVIPCRGTPLGRPDLVLGSVQDRLQPGERILLVTDGMLEIKQRNGRQLGMRGFVRLCEETLGDAVPLGSQKVVTAIERLQEGEAQADDWTLLTIEWHGPGDVRVAGGR